MKKFYKICLLVISCITVALVAAEYLLLSSNRILLEEASAMIRNIQRREEAFAAEDESCSRVLYGGGDEDLYGRNSTEKDTTNSSRVVEYLRSGCESFKSRYRFVTQQGSVEEKEFPIAFSILVHSMPHQFAMMLSAIYSPHNLYCIHVDAKVNGHVFEAFRMIAQCFPNVFLTEKREYIVYASFARLKADINCMQDLLEVNQEWKYLVNLCGQDFPLRTNLELVHQLKALQGRNMIPGCDVTDVPTLRRTRYVYRAGNISLGEGRTEERMLATEEKHPPPPFDVAIRKNLAYNFYTRDFLHWAMYESKEARALLEWSRDTYSPDEHYWLTVNTLPGAPGGSADVISWWSPVTYIMWVSPKHNNCKGYVRHSICVFSSGDLRDVIRRHESFANKFDVTRDVKAVRCLRHWLDERRLGRNSERNPRRRPSLPSWIKALT